MAPEDLEEMIAALKEAAEHLEFYKLPASNAEIAQKCRAAIP